MTFKYIYCIDDQWQDDSKWGSRSSTMLRTIWHLPRGIEGNHMTKRGQNSLWPGQDDLSTYRQIIPLLCSVVYNVLTCKTRWVSIWPMGFAHCLSMSYGIPEMVQIIVVELLTYSMVQSLSWEANWSAANQETPHISQNPKVHYRTHKRPPPVSILGQPNPVHIPTSHFLEIHSNIIHPSTPRSPQWSLSLRFPHQDPIHPPLLTHTPHMPSPSHSSRFYHRTILGEQYKPKKLMFTG